MFFLPPPNRISDIDQLKQNESITFFEMAFQSRPESSILQELCIEIAKHTPDAQKGKNEDAKNEGRLNPYVGAVLLKKSSDSYQVFGACRSAVHNGEHGECSLLMNILSGYVVEGCEMFVSLEPCTQESRHEWTEPCCEIIKNRRIRKVTIGMLDPNPDVAGHGITYLIKNGVEVELFDPKYQKIVREDNEGFSKQFGDDGDPRLNRKIARILDTYVSYPAIDLFLRYGHEELDIPFYEDRFQDNKKNLYRLMIENRSIIDGRSGLLPFDVIDEFALFFFKKPYHKVDGATIRYFMGVNADVNEIDDETLDFNGPYAFAFESFIEGKGLGNDSLGFLEAAGKRYYGDGGLENLNANGKQFIRDVFGGDKGLKIVREAFVNAVIHRDYLNDQSFTKVVFGDDRIEIFNPVRKTGKPFEEMKEEFESLKTPSHPTNPKLMRYFQMVNVCERNGSGMASLKASKRVKMELGEDYILKTTLFFKPMK